MANDATELTVTALFAQPDNAGVLKLLELHRPEDAGYFRVNHEPHPLDEGGQDFFYGFGALVPQSAWCALRTYNVMVHPHTARIFALHWGRYTFALRPDFSRPEALQDCFCNDSLTEVTADGFVNFRVLGCGWVLFGVDRVEDAELAFLHAYELAGHE